MTAPALPLSRPRVSKLLALASRQRGVDGRAEIRCAGCGYGAVVARLPERCPSAEDVANAAEPARTADTHPAVEHLHLEEGLVDVLFEAV